jgi:pyrophosphate--fructose-6-phosphate 1-phosphotransferase
VIWGIVDAVSSLSPQGRVTGFRGGPAGILANDSMPLSDDIVKSYRNSGGFDLLGTSRSKIDTPEKLAKCRSVLEGLAVDALVIIGGDDSNTNAAVLAEYLVGVGSAVTVIGVPKTIDGDMQNALVETTFGFDSAVRVYAELVSNISRDTLSGRKYYHFVRLMGRAASHITMEVALQTQPTIALIAEEVAAKKQTLYAIVSQIAEVVKERADRGKHYGVILVPEGIIEFIPEMRALISELNQIIAEHHEYLASLSGFTEQSEYLHRKLSRDTSYTFSGLPIDIQRQLLMDRDPHGNVALSRI